MRGHTEETVRPGSRLTDSAAADTFHPSRVVSQAPKYGAARLRGEPRLRRGQAAVGLRRRAGQDATKATLSQGPQSEHLQHVVGREASVRVKRRLLLDGPVARRRVKRVRGDVVDLARRAEGGECGQEKCPLKEGTRTFACVPSS